MSLWQRMYLHAANAYADADAAVMLESVNSVHPNVLTDGRRGMM